MTAQIVEIAGHKMALLPMEEYERLLDIVEEKADELAAEGAERRRVDGEEYLPAELIDRILDGQSALKAWREFRRLTQEELGKRSNTSNVNICRMEQGKQLGNLEVWRSVAKALNVSVQDIFPFN